jgi:hypothetical protein
VWKFQKIEKQGGETEIRRRDMVEMSKRRSRDEPSVTDNEPKVTPEHCLMANVDVSRYGNNDDKDGNIHG